LPPLRGLGGPSRTLEDDAHDAQLDSAAAIRAAAAAELVGDTSANDSSNVQLRAGTAGGTDVSASNTAAGIKSSTGHQAPAMAKASVSKPSQQASLDLDEIVTDSDVGEMLVAGVDDEDMASDSSSPFGRPPDLPGLDRSTASPPPVPQHHPEARESNAGTSPPAQSSALAQLGAMAAVSPHRPSEQEGIVFILDRCRNH
jgi:hypothetical protein